MRARRLLLAALLLGCTLTWAQEDPNAERGVRPGLAYRLEGLDQVNLFNGMMTLNVPVGPTYQVGGTLSYSFMASYATNPWSQGTNVYDDPYIEEKFTEFHYMYPAKYTNAGMGWVVTLGRIVENATNPGSEPKTYLAPDGSQHKFEFKLHSNDPNEPTDSTVSYTRDGTYLRLRRRPDLGWSLDFPNGHTHEFNAQGLITELRDPHGNKVTVTYKKRSDFVPSDPNPDSTVWVIKDTQNREHKVWFLPGWSYPENTWSASIAHELVEKIEVLSFGGNTATWKFNYEVPYHVIQPGESIEPLKTYRRPAPRPDGNVPDYVIVSLLSSIELQPTSTDSTTASYAFVTHRTTGPSGNITRLTLPTAGTVEWTYQHYRFPVDQSRLMGVSKRTAHDGSTKIGETEYILDNVVPGNYLSDLTRLVVNRDGSGAILNGTKHYFSGCRSTAFCLYPGDYGLPFTRTEPAGPGYLSTEFIAPDASGQLTNILRRTYVGYEADIPFGSVPLWRGINQRKYYDRTVYLDDGGRYIETTLSSFDGLGHYRKAVNGGDLTAAAPQTTFTNYNPTRGTFALDSNDEVTGFTMIPKTSPWILNTYDQQWVAEPDEQGVEQHSATTSCFSATGLLTSRRTYKSFWTPNGTTVPDKDKVPVPSTTDLLTVFTHDSTGHLVKEQYLGGDVGIGAPALHLCGNTYGSENYRIDRAYSHGVLSSSWYVDGSGSKMSFYLQDRAIDATGLTSVSRQFRPTATGAADVFLTEYEYDQLGRVTKATTKSRTHGATLDESAKTTYTYALNPPSITTTDQKLGPNPATIGVTTAELDRFGRLVRETRRMPGGTTSSRSTAYNSLGWKVRTRDWGATEETVYTYDALGRPIIVRTPDQTDATATTLSYTGAASMTRETSVRTGGGATSFTFTRAATTEDYDAQGRLIRVTEPLTTTGTGGVRPVTEYRYDVADRLVKVCANKSGTTCSQTRTFKYDNRGFLVEETHPESGTTYFLDYDSRGHLGRRYENALYTSDVSYWYDRAERLYYLFEKLSSNDDRPLKVFNFASANASNTSLSNGQLASAARYNWLPNGTAVQVWESYSYDAEGQPGSRVTTDYTCQPTVTTDCEAAYSGTLTHQFTQSFTQQPDVQTITYPTCTVGCGSASPSRTVTENYAYSRLQSVTWDSKTATLEYHPSGLVTEVSHPNTVTDVVTPDRIVSRPERIVTSGIVLQGSCVGPAFSTQPKSKTVTSGTTVTLTAVAGGESGQTITYRWYRGTAPDESTPAGSETGSLTVSPSTTTSYWVKASNDCGGTASNTVTITVCTKPIVNGPPDDTISDGQVARLVATVNSSATAPVTWQWYTVGTSVTAIPGATSRELNVSPSSTTTYRVQATNSCGSHSEDSVLTVIPAPTRPTAVSAEFVAAEGRVRITWTASTSQGTITSYRIDRSDGLWMAASTSLVHYDSSVAAGKAYTYRVRAIDSNAISSAPSTPDVASIATFTDDPIRAPGDPSGGTVVRGVHLGELRRAVDEIRQLAGLPVAWTDYGAATGVIHATQFADLQDRLNDARLVLELPPVAAFTQPVAIDPLIRRNIIEVLRGGVK